jgi:hypothetical protein
LLLVHTSLSGLGGGPNRPPDATAELVLSLQYGHCRRKRLINLRHGLILMRHLTVRRRDYGPLTSGSRNSVDVRQKSVVRNAFTDEVRESFHHVIERPGRRAEQRLDDLGRFE